MSENVDLISGIHELEDRRRRYEQLMEVSTAYSRLSEERDRYQRVLEKIAARGDASPTIRGIARAALEK